MREYLKTLYLDYVNNFITVQAFADYYDFDLDEAHDIINKGRKYHVEDLLSET